LENIKIFSSAQRNSAEVGEDTRSFYNELLSANPNWPENELVVQSITMEQRYCWLKPGHKADGVSFGNKVSKTLT